MSNIPTYKHTSLQPVDVLGVTTEQQSLVLKQANKVMRWIWPVLHLGQTLQPPAKWPRVFCEIMNVKQSFRVGQVVLMEAVVETSSWTPVQGNRHIES